MIKLSSVGVRRCPSVCKEFLQRNPTYWDFFSKRKITPAERHPTTSKMASFAAVRDDKGQQGNRRHNDGDEWTG